MKAYSERVQGPLVIDGRAALHCVVATHVLVTGGGEMLLYGDVLGDVRVNAGGRAAIHGRVHGTLFNAGECEVSGVVARHVCLPGGTTATVGESATIRREGRITASAGSA